MRDMVSENWRCDRRFVVVAVVVVEGEQQQQEDEEQADLGEEESVVVDEEKEEGRRGGAAAAAAKADHRHEEETSDSGHCGAVATACEFGSAGRVGGSGPCVDANLPRGLQSKLESHPNCS